MIPNYLNIGTPEIIFVVVFTIVGFYTIYQCINNPQLTSTQRMTWLAVILIIPVFGCLIYLFANKRKRHQNKLRK